MNYQYFKSSCDHKSNLGVQKAIFKKDSTDCSMRQIFRRGNARKVQEGTLSECKRLGYPTSYMV